MNSKTCGRETSCDLVLGHPTVSRIHARIELGDDGFVRVRDSGSKNGTFLNRNDTWIRIRSMTLCIGDRVRFGDCEVALPRLTAVFGKRAGARLEAKHFPPPGGLSGARISQSPGNQDSSLQKPRRNPVTGKIEEDQASAPAEKL